MEKSSFPSSYYVNTNLNKYLKNLPGESFFNFNMKNNIIECLINHPEWVHHFFDEKTMKDKETM